jgi:superfamily I DNA/RNA helicase
VAWARRAAQRGERVLVTCFNEPLADVMSARMADLGVTVGCFHQIARFIDGMPPLDVPEDADGEWWDTVMAGHLQSNWHRVTERFDTIIVDEGQDLSLAWLTMLEQLLHDEGPRRMMVLADTNQTIWERGFRVPGNEDGWTRCELSENCRNTSQIAALLRRHLGGDPSAVGGPESESVRFVEVDDEEAAVGEVGEEIDVILDEQDHNPDSILVCTTSRALRDQLIDDYAFVRWEERAPHQIVCETIHRVKGLEFDHVVIATADESITDELLYVGIGRAVISLTVIAPEPVIVRLRSERPRLS